MDNQQRQLSVEFRFEKNEVMVIKVPLPRNIQSQLIQQHKQEDIIEVEVPQLLKTSLSQRQLMKFIQDSRNSESNWKYMVLAISLRNEYYLLQLMNKKAQRFDFEDSLLRVIFRAENNWLKQLTNGANTFMDWFFRRFNDQINIDKLWLDEKFLEDQQMIEFFLTDYVEYLFCNKLLNYEQLDALKTYYIDKHNCEQNYDPNVGLKKVVPWGKVDAQLIEKFQDIFEPDELRSILVNRLKNKNKLEKDTQQEDLQEKIKSKQRQYENLLYAKFHIRLDYLIRKRQRIDQIHSQKIKSGTEQKSPNKTQKKTSQSMIIQQQTQPKEIKQPKQIQLHNSQYCNEEQKVTLQCKCQVCLSCIKTRYMYKTGDNSMGPIVEAQVNKYSVGCFRCNKKLTPEDCDLINAMAIIE